MTLAQALAAVALAFFARQHRNAVPIETPAEVRDRMALIGRSAVKACELEPIANFPVEWCAPLLQNLAQFESALWLPIHEARPGRVKDGGGIGPSGERGLPQIHHSVTSVPSPRFRVTEEDWARIGGASEADTIHAFRIEARILGWHAQRCRETWHGRFEFRAAVRLYSEYHQPSPDCSVVRSSVAVKRAQNFDRIYFELKGSPRK